MASPLTNRRRAERFSQLLDEANGGRRQHLRTTYDDEVGDLVALQRRLVEEIRAPELDHEFRTGLRAMLVATAQREGIGATAEPEPSEPPPANPWLTHPLVGAATARLRTAFAQGPRTRTAVIAGVTVGAVAFTGMSTASENAMPGDALYGVKRSAERAQLALASSDLGRGQLYLEFAQTRLAEARTLANDLSRVLSDMDRDTSHGVRLLTTAATNRQDRAALRAIETFSAEQRTALGELAGQVDSSERAPILASLELLDEIDERASDLRGNLDRDCTAVSSIDMLGPVPADCVTLPAPAAVPNPATGQPAAAGEGHPTPTETAPASPSASADPEPTGDAATPEVTGSATADPPPSASPGPSTTPSGQVTDAPPTGSAEDDPGLAYSVNRLLANLLGH
nr:DUF5667 domain-containing protein [Natronosporangium hydrolyticum]